MTEAIYRVGDILEIPGNVVLPRQFGMFPKEETCRCLVLNVLHPGFDSISYTFLTHKDGFGTFNIIGVNHTNIADCAKLIGHCDISALRYEKPEEGSGDTDLLMLFTAGTIAYTADLRNELDKIKKENEKLKAENEALSDTLSKSEVKAQSRLNRNEVLKRENEELRGHNEKLYQALSESEADNAMLKSQIACMEGRIESLAQKCDQLDADNRYLSTRVKHLTISNNSLRANLAEETSKRMQAEAELNEKAKELNEVYHSDIVCENNKLRDENRILNEIVNGFKSTCANCEARSDNERLRADNEKLRAANASFSQKIKCAERYFDSAAAALYDGREHLSIAQNSISNK